MPDPAYSLFPLPRGFEEIMGAPGMAFCINQPVGALKKPVCRLHKQEMLPDVSGVAGMHPVIISAHQLGHVSFLLDGSSLNQVGRLNCNFPSLRYIISMRFFVVLKPLALLFAD